MFKRICNSAYFSILSSLIVFNCYAVDPSSYYYPPTSPGDDSWTTVDASSLGWDTDALDDAITYAGDENSRALIILHKGRIVSENYWSVWDLHTRRRIWSAHKTMAGLVFSIAQDENLVTRDDFVSDYLGALENGWSNATEVQEALVQIRHLQTMTSGMSGNLQGDINYETEPDTEWRYNTAAYRLMRDIIGLQNPDGDYDQFIQTRLYDRIGMNDSITTEGTSINSARDMARFGLMMLGNGTWDGIDIIEDKDYLAEMSIPSQGFNEAYGNLTWLNGQGSYMVPLDPAVYTGELIPAAPADLFAALGRDDKKIYMAPSLDLVVVRHGPAASTGGGLGLSGFDNALWEKLCLAMNDCQPVDIIGTCTDWTEDFALANGTTNDAGNTAWFTDDSALSIASPNDYFEVRNDEFRARDIDGEGVWMSEVISTGGADFAVSVDIRETGRHEDSDYISLNYKLDGGAEVEFAYHNNDFGSGGITESTGILSGDNVQIVIRARNNGGREVHYWDDVSVNCQ